MPNYPESPQPACWAIFDAGGLQGAYFWSEIDEAVGMTEQQAEAQAFAAVNANRDDPAVYLVKCLWQDRTDHHTWYEQGDRVYAPTGGDPDRVPPG